MKDPNFITMKNGSPTIQGTCPPCGTKIFRIGKGELRAWLEIIERLDTEEVPALFTSELFAYGDLYVRYHAMLSYIWDREKQQR